MTNYYWQLVDPPVSFIPEGWSYEQKRTFRYANLAYLPNFVDFARYKGKAVLCIGDGSGIDATEFARAGALVHVIDLSEKAVDLTRKHFVEARTNGPGMSCDVGDARELPYDAGMFDVAYSFGVVHHIDRASKAVSEIARVLKHGGEFIGMVYHRESLLYAYSILLRAQREGISPDEAMRNYSERNPGCPHSVAYTPDELRTLLAPHFETIATEIQYPVIDLPTGMRKVPVLVSTDDAGRSLGWHLCFRAVK